MEKRPYFVAADVAGNVGIGLIAVAVSTLVFGGNIGMLPGMLGGMLIGMIIGMLLGFGVLAPLFGIMEVVVPCMMSGMVGGMIGGNEIVGGPQKVAPHPPHKGDH